MKKIGFVLALLAVVLSASFVSAEQEKTFEFSASMDVLSKYVGGLTGAEIYDGFVIQPSVTLAHIPSGIYANIWTSYSPDGGFSSDYGDEIDYTIGIAHQIGSVSFDFYYAFYDVGRLNTLEEGDAHALGMRANFPKIWKIVPYLCAEYDFIVESSRGNGLA